MAKKLLSLFLVLLMLVTALPVAVFAEAANEDVYVWEDTLMQRTDGYLSTNGYWDKNLKVYISLPIDAAVNFDFSGSISGTYNLYIRDPDTSEVLYTYKGENGTGISVDDPMVIDLPAGIYVADIECVRFMTYSLEVSYRRVFTKDDPYFYVDPNPNVSVVYADKPATFKVCALPESATIPSNIKWAVSNKKIATVDSKGVVTGLKSGTIRIAAFVNGKKYLYEHLEIVAPKYTGPSDFTLYEDTTKTLSVKVSPSDYPYKKVTWKSSKTSVATVNSKGVVTAKAPGKATITATINGKKLSCVVTVKKMAISDTKKTVYAGETYTLKMNGGTGTVTWKSSNTSVAKIDSKGVITAVKPGTTTITAKKEGKTFKCTVTVKWPPENGTTSSKIIRLKNGASAVMKKLTLKGKSTVTVTARINSGNDSLYLVLEDKNYSNIWSQFVRAGDGKFTKKVTLEAGTYYLYYDTKNNVDIAYSIVTKPQITASSKYVGRGYTLTLKPVAVKNGGTWSTSNKKIATVSSTGVVKGVKNGSCTIYYTMKDGKKLSYKVTVKDPVTVSVTHVYDTSIYNECDVKFVNYTNKKIDYVEFQIYQYDYKGRKLSSPYSYFYYDKGLAAGKSTTREYWVNNNTKTCKTKIYEVKFTDGTKWKP